MNKFCVVCGSENTEEGATFCAKCGASLTGNQQVQQTQAPVQEQTQAPVDVTVKGEPTVTVVPTPVAKAKVPMDKKITRILIIAITGVLVAIILICVCLFASTPEKPVKNFFNGRMKGNAQTMLKSVPKSYAKELAEDENLTLKEYQKAVQEELDKELERQKDTFEDYKITFKILDKEKIKGDDLDDIKDDYMKYHDQKVTDAMVVIIKMKQESPDDLQVETTEIEVLKIGGKWYCDFDDIYFPI